MPARRKLWRKVASRYDEQRRCHICGDFFVRKNAIILTTKYIPIHKRCSHKYLAAVVSYYGLNTIDLILKFKLTARTAYRVMEQVRILEGR